jgi:basic membrane protein A
LERAASEPTATVQVIFTGDWAMPVKEAESATSLINQGVDVLTCHVDSPKVILETAERRGVYVCGYHADGSKLAPKGYLTGAEWNWSKVYTDYAGWVRAGKSLSAGTIPHLVRGGLKEGFVKCSDYGPAVGDEAKKSAEAAKAAFMNGTMVIFKGPLVDNTRKEILPAGKEFKQQDLELESMGWLVDGVLGSTKS